MCDNPECGGHGKTQAELQQQTLDTIIKYGHQVIGVLADEESGHRFAYSVGRSVKDLPELVVNGPLPQKVAQHMINEAARLQDEEDIPLADGYEFEPNTLIAGFPVRVVKVDPARSQMFQALFLFGDDIEALQLVWPDTNGAWPGEPGYTERYFQPIYVPV